MSHIINNEKRWVRQLSINDNSRHSIERSNEVIIYELFFIGRNKR